MKYLAAALGMSLITSTASYGQDWQPGTPQFQFQSWVIDHEREPQQASDVAVQFTESELVQIAALYYGVPIEAIVGATLIAPLLKTEAEGHFIEGLRVPEGYKPCRVKIETHFANVMARQTFLFGGTG